MRETYQVKSPGAGFGCRRVVSLYLQHEDAMTSRGPLIGQSLGPGTVLSRLLDNDFCRRRARSAPGRSGRTCSGEVAASAPSLAGRSGRLRDS